MAFEPVYPERGIRYQKSVHMDMYQRADGEPTKPKCWGSFAIGNEPRLVAADRGNLRFARELLKLFVNYQNTRNLFGIA